MYRNAREVIDGLLKNATEGLAELRRIVPFSLLLLMGQIAPVVLFAYVWLSSGSVLLKTISLAGLLCCYLPCWLASVRFRQPLFATLFHPVSIIVLLGLQWIALCRSALRVPATWKGGSYSNP